MEEKEEEEGGYVFALVGRCVCVCVCVYFRLDFACGGGGLVGGGVAVGGGGWCG